MTNFCPEVVFDQFGYFATDLFAYSDETDHEFGIDRMAKDEMPADHWGWNWNNATTMHYSDCPIYSVLRERKADVVEAPPWADRLLGRLRNHPALGLVIVLAAIVIGLGAFSDALQSIVNLVRGWFGR
jgi:hypothetical protein